MSRYIDADKLTDDMINTFRDDEDGIAINEYWSHQVVLDVIEKEETADVKPVVRGEWIEDGEGEIYCSKCGKYTYDRHDEIKEFDGKTVIALCYPRFCGNCGAMMSQECNT